MNDPFMSTPVTLVNDPDVKASTESIADRTQQFRSQVGHISRQSGVFFAGTIFTSVFGYIFKVYLARVLGAEALGLYALGITLIGLIGIVNTLGLPHSAVRFVAAYRASGKFKELHALLWRGAGLLVAANVVLAAVLLTFGRFLAVRFYHSPTLVRYLPLFALMMLFSVLTTFYGKVLAGYRDIKLRTLIVSFVGSPLNMLIAVWLISAGMGLRGYLVAQILSAALVCLMLLVAVRRFTPTEARFTGQSGSHPEKAVWSFSAAMLGIGFLEFLMNQVDKIALGFYRGAREVGIYSVAAAVVVYVPLVLSSVNQIFAPTISDLHTRGDYTLLARLFQSLTKWVVGLTLPLAIVIVVFARPFMGIFGADFETGWPILIIGTLGQLVNCGVGSVGYLLLMSGNERRLIKVQIVMAVVMVACSAALVPIWGIVGAAIAAAITNVGMNAWNLLEVHKALGISPYNRGYWRLLPPTVVTLVVTLALKKYSYMFHHNWLAIIVTLGLAYCIFAAIVLMGVLDTDDRLIATAIWSRIRVAFIRAGAET
jgi:O-antigen/teichoic acid export membrane protein